MGRWIEINDNNVFTNLQGTNPHPIIHCICYLPKDIRQEFPMLNSIDLQSSLYIDEVQILDREKLIKLQEELTRLRDITKFKIFIAGVDSKQFYERWKGEESEENFDWHLYQIDKLIQIAIDDDLTVRISL